MQWCKTKVIYFIKLNTGLMEQLIVTSIVGKTQGGQKTWVLLWEETFNWCHCVEKTSPLEQNDGGDFLLFLLSFNLIQALIQCSLDVSVMYEVFTITHKTPFAHIFHLNYVDAENKLCEWAWKNLRYKQVVTEGFQAHRDSIFAFSCKQQDKMYWAKQFLWHLIWIFCTTVIFVSVEAAEEAETQSFHIIN